MAAVSSTAGRGMSVKGEPWIVHQGHVLDVLATLPAASVHCVVTSPPYWGLRDYKLPLITWPDGWTGHLGLEPTVEQWVAHLVEVFRAVRRVLRDDGVCWVNLGDSYAGAGYSNHANTGGCQREHGGKQKHTRASGLKPLDLIGQPWMLAFALRADGWYLRSDVVWAKPNPMPESVAGWRWERCRVKLRGGIRSRQGDPGDGAGWESHGDEITDRQAAAWSECPGCSKCASNAGLVLRRGAWRPTKAHEYVFMLAKSPDYYADGEAVKEEANRQASGNLQRKLDVPTRPNDHRGSSIPWENNGSGRNLRSVWTIATQPFPGAHFATFPEALVAPCIKAGTSERGVCAGCGAPWARVVERNWANTPTRVGTARAPVDTVAVSDYLRQRRTALGLSKKQVDDALGTRTLYSWFEGRPAGIEAPTPEQWIKLKEVLQLDERFDDQINGTVDVLITDYSPPKDWQTRNYAKTWNADFSTLGWRPTCACGGEPVPATVLDPFAGSGTVGVVAVKLDRRFIGIELSEPYCAMARRRIGEVAPLFAGRTWDERP